MDTRYDSTPIVPETPAAVNLQEAVNRSAFHIPDNTARRRNLKALQSAMERYEPQLLDALSRDLGKGEFEARTNETGLVRHEIVLALRNLGRWTRPRRPVLELFLQPGAARTDRVPRGDVLIIAPWNFPVMLALSPLVSALAAGNRVVIKPSELAPESARVIGEMIRDAFPDGGVRVVPGGPRETALLMESGFDFVFFTGSSRVGRIIMKHAAATLTPVVLELGGRNPAVVATDAHMKQTVRQIAWGKFNNAGQACVAPDHVYVPRHRKEEFIRELKKVITDFFGEDPRTSRDFGRIISPDHVRRLEGFLTGGNLAAGGVVDHEERYVAPTIIDSPDPDAAVLQEEIFGPILPVLPYDSLDDVLEEINSRPASLARYAFTGSRRTAGAILSGTRYGSGMVNGTVIHFASSRLPFGGTGESGMGRAHGKAGFEAFSRTRSIITRPFGLDLPVAYPGARLPLGLIRRLMG